MRDDKFTTTARIVNLHPSVGTHWVIFSNQNHSDSYGFAPPVNLTKQIIGGFHSEYQTQKNDIFCAAYCLYVLYLANILGIYIRLNLYYQTYTYS